MLNENKDKNKISNILKEWATNNTNSVEMSEASDNIADFLVSNLTRVLPCEIGSTLYILSRNEVIPVFVNSISYGQNDVKISCSNEEYWGYGSIILYPDKGVIPWYSSEEEAQRALKISRATAKRPFELDAIKAKYPVGTRIKLIQTDKDIKTPLDETIGVVESVNDDGSILVRWKSGSSLKLYEGVNKFEVFE